jgi:hypothetical protein
MKGYRMIEVITKDKFAMIIETMVRDDRLSYVDAICHWCEQNEIEIETAAKLISPVIKEKMLVECQDLNLLVTKPCAKLPI